MKLRHLSTSALTAIATLVIVGCASNETPERNSPARTGASTEERSEEGQNLRIGMTKGQVLRAWGSPSGKDITGHGEVWVYGNQRALRMIPYAGPWVNVQTRKVLFGADGRVRDFRSTDEGNEFSAGEGQGGSGFSPF
jgi:outer membrane protein assembly factor BamE (lipoprotein component of BamABCDE complex)